MVDNVIRGIKKSVVAKVSSEEFIYLGGLLNILGISTLTNRIK